MDELIKYKSHDISDVSGTLMKLFGISFDINLKTYIKNIYFDDSIIGYIENNFSCSNN